MATPNRNKMGTDLSVPTIQQAAAGQLMAPTGAQTPGQITGVLGAWFGPLNPIPPTAPEGTKGRILPYTPGYNTLIPSQRPLEPLSFYDLRFLARSLDLCTAAIETRKDQVETVTWEFRVKSQQKRSKDKPDPRIQELEDFFGCPDPESAYTGNRWTRKLLDDVLVLDHAPIYLKRNKGGKPYAFRIIDGATIKLLIDDQGLPPAMPNPRYQQWLYGSAVGNFNADEMLVMQRNPRPDKLFGFSQVEQVWITLNIALRKQLLNLNKYTEGTIPEAMVSCPPEWDGEQIAQFQLYFDQLLTGQYAEQSKMRFMPSGVDKAIFPKNFDNADQYDNFLAKIIMYVFSLPSTWLTDKANRATAEQAQDAALQEGLMPLLVYLGDLKTRLVHWGWGYKDIECVPKMQKEIDVLQQAQAKDIRIRNGTLSVDEVRLDLGETEIGQPNAVYVAATGYVTIGTQGKDEAAEALANAPDPTKPPTGAKPPTPIADAETPKDDEVTPPDEAVKAQGGFAKAAKKKLKMLPMTGHQKAERHISTALTKFL